MTVGLYGTPDWIRTQPGGSRALYSGSYTSGAFSSLTLVTADVSRFQAVSMTVAPDQDSYVEVQYYDGTAASVFLFERVYTIHAGGQGRINVPCLSQWMRIRITRIDGGAPATGSASVTGHNAGFARDANTGIELAYSQTGYSLAAGALIRLNTVDTVEGAGVLMLTCNGQPGFALLEILQTNGTFALLAEIVPATTTASVTIPVQVPGYSTRLTVHNTGAAVGTFDFSLTVGA